MHYIEFFEERLFQEPTVRSKVCNHGDVGVGGWRPLTSNGAGGTYVIVKLVNPVVSFMASMYVALLCVCMCV